MSDKYAIDSHKLIYHPLRVAKWLSAENNWENQKGIYPVYVEISPVGACNHRCTFCAVDYIGYRNIRWETELLKNRLSEMAKLGIKSIMFAGEGEPLFHKDLDQIVEHSNKVGIDCSITTNFVYLNEKNVLKILKNTSWIKVSLNAGTAETYSKIHRTKEEDFHTVLNNLELAVKTRKEHNLECTIGAQLLLLPENKHEVIEFVTKMKSAGIDYVVIKPYSQHLFSKTKTYEKIDYADLISLEETLNEFNDDNFNVVFRSNTMKKLNKAHDYDKCLSTPYFWAHIMADGDVYGCSAYLKQEKFCYGNLKEIPFKEIWEGDKRKKSVQFVKDELDISNCRSNCRMDEVNRYLWRLQNPNSHDNFI